MYFGSNEDFEIAMKALRRRRLEAYWRATVEALEDPIRRQLRAVIEPLLPGVVDDYTTLFN
jgi:hypothetical protein